jgi:hypothetical protein
MLPAKSETLALPSALGRPARRGAEPEGEYRTPAAPLTSAPLKQAQLIVLAPLEDHSQRQDRFAVRKVTQKLNRLTYRRYLGWLFNVER